MHSTTDRLVPVPEAAKRLGVAPRTLRGWIAAGVMPCVRLSSRCVRIHLADLAAFVEARKS